MPELNQKTQHRNMLADAVDGKPAESIKGYTRAVRRKLYFLFAMLILVLIMMKEARKPENWMWMGFRKAAADSEAIELNGFERESSTELRLENETSVGLLPADTYAASATERIDDQQRTEFWKQVWELLPLQDRTALVELIQVAQKIPDQRDINPDDFYPLTSSLSQVNPEEGDYLEKWDSVIRPGLLAVAEGEDVSLSQQTAIKKLFETLDPLILDQLDDFTSPSRKSDMPAWHRFWGRILEDDFGNSAPSVSPVQLVAQPDVWRFQPVRIQGKLLAGRVKKAGIHGPLRNNGVWYEWWIGNSHGANEVWCVYTANKPDSIDVSENFSDFDLPIEFTGLFYKVRSYVDAESKGNHCPLVLAYNLSVTKKRNIVAEATWEKPSTVAMIIGVTTVMGIAFVIAMLVHRSDRIKIHQPGGEHKKQIENHLDALGEDPDIKTVAERLEELQ